MTKTTKGLLVILAISILMLAGVLIWQNLVPDTKKNILPISQKITSVKEIKPAISTKDWQTYTDDKQAYSFRYPQDWKTSGVGVDPTVGEDDKTFPEDLNFTMGGACLKIDPLSDCLVQTLVEIGDVDSASQRIEKEKGKASREKIKISNQVIDKLTIGKKEYYLFEKNGQVFVLAQENMWPKYQKQFPNQNISKTWLDDMIFAILGSFSFPTYESSVYNDWQTYTNKEFNFTLKYPKDYTYIVYPATKNSIFYVGFYKNDGLVGGKPQPFADSFYVNIMNLPKDGLLPASKFGGNFTVTSASKKVSADSTDPVLVQTLFNVDPEIDYMVYAGAKDGKRYSLSLQSSNGNVIRDYHKVLHSFKFTN